MSSPSHPHQKLQALVRALPCVGFVIDEDGEYVDVLVNERTEVLLYDDPQNLLGRRLHDVFPDERSERFHTTVQRALDTGSVQTLTYNLDTLDGSRRFQGHVVPIRPEYGGNSHAIWLAEELTDGEADNPELEHDRTFRREVEQMAEVGGWELDTRTEELRWTDGTRHIHETDDDYEPTLEEALEFYHPEDRETIQRLVRQCRDEGQVYEVELRIITAKGSQRWVTVRGEPVYGDDDIVMIRGVISDISERKQREQRLMVMNRVLRHNLRNDLNVIMGHANDLREEIDAIEIPDELRDVEAAEHLIEQIDQLTQSAGEMATEFDAIQQGLNHLLSFPVDKINEDAEAILERADNLASLGEKTRRFDKLLASTEVHERVELAPLLECRRDEYREKYPGASIDIVGAADVAVRGDRQMLEMALNEVLTNAIKHNDQNVPQVELGVSRQTPNRVAIAVADDGPGIPEMEREVLDRGDEQTLSHSRGIGLWIVNWILLHLGGTVHIGDNEPRGTVVELVLPAPENV